MRKDRSYRKDLIISILVMGIIFLSSLVTADESGSTAMQQLITAVIVTPQTGTDEFLWDDTNTNEDQGEPSFRVSVNDTLDAFLLIDSDQDDIILDSFGDKHYRAIFGIHLSL